MKKPSAMDVKPSEEQVAPAAQPKPQMQAHNLLEEEKVEVIPAYEDSPQKKLDMPEAKPAAYGRQMSMLADTP